MQLSPLPPSALEGAQSRKEVFLIKVSLRIVIDPRTIAALSAAFASLHQIAELVRRFW